MGLVICAFVLVFAICYNIISYVRGYATMYGFTLVILGVFSFFFLISTRSSNDYKLQIIKDYINNKEQINVIYEYKTVNRGGLQVDEFVPIDTLLVDNYLPLF